MTNAPPDHLSASHAPRQYQLAVNDLRDKLDSYQFLLANNRRKIEDLTAEAEELEDRCKPVEDRIASLRAAIRALEAHL